jgi:RNA recognition motif-containing protein
VEKMDIYVGNLSYQATEDELKELFGRYGEVASVNIVKDKFTGRSRGFAFVEMSAKGDGDSAIQGLDGKDFQGRALKVNEARSRTEGPRTGGGGRRQGGPRY